MKYLALDIGSYSIKTTLLNFEKRQLNLLDASEFVYEDLKNEIDPEGDLSSLKRTLVKNIIPEDFEGKTIFQIPNQMITSRHLSLPVTQRKKVDMMIPFQLDENLPFSAMDAHFFSQLDKKANTTSALVNVTKRSEFTKLFESYDAVDALPTILTSELSVLNAHALNKAIQGPLAILDIGHSTAKCYLIYEGEVVTHHFSFCAGAAIDEVISETYQIPLKEAVIYKHQNCFLLTEGQYDSVNEEQKEFALLMKKTLMPLVLEVKRWLLGFRVKYGMPIEKIYLTGGTSNIHNISNFFSQHTGVKTDYFSVGESIIDTEEKLSGAECSYFLSSLMVSSLTQKNKPGNFLIGDFSTGGSITLPMHSAAFIFQRSAILTLVLSILFGVDYFLLNRKKVSLKRQMQVVRKANIKLTPREKNRPEQYINSILKKATKRQEDIKQEVSTLMAATKDDNVTPIIQLFSSISAAKDLELTELETSADGTKGTFKTGGATQMKTLQESLQAASLPGLQTKVKGNYLNFSYGSVK